MHVLSLIKRKPNSNHDGDDYKSVLFQRRNLQTEEIRAGLWLTCLILWLRCWILLETVWQTFCQKIKRRYISGSAAQIPDTVFQSIMKLVCPTSTLSPHISNVIVQGPNIPRWTSRSDTYLPPRRNRTRCNVSSAHFSCSVINLFKHPPLVSSQLILTFY